MSLGSSSCSESDDDQDSEIGNRVALQFLPYNEENLGDTGGEAQGGAGDGFHLDELSLEDDEFKTGSNTVTPSGPPEGTPGAIQGLVECERSESCRHFSTVTGAGNGNQSGSNYLIGRAFFGNDYLASTLRDEEGSLFFYLAHILQLVPSSKHKLVEKFLFTAFSCFKERERLYTLLGNNIPYTPDLPNSTKYCALYYEGKNALLPNLPHQKIHVRNDHAFSHPSDVICHHLAYGSEVLAPFPVYEDGSPMDDVGLEQQCADPYPMRSLEETPAYAKIFLPTARSRLRHPCVLCTLWWSDDFEPNNVKNN
jgi:hypothetical protein